MPDHSIGVHVVHQGATNAHCCECETKENIISEAQHKRGHMIAVTQFAVESLQYAGGHTSAASEFLTAIFGQAKEDLKTAGSTVSLPNLRF